jgi:hypothetical protein
MLLEHARAVRDLQHALWQANRFLVKHGQRPLDGGPWRWRSTTVDWR